MMIMVTSSHRGCSIKKAVLKNVAMFTGKHLCWNLFLINNNNRSETLLKTRLQHRSFPVNFAKFLRSPILKNIYERLLLSNNDDE